MRRLEGEGVPSKHAEVITSAITEVLNDSLENVSQSFVSKSDMQRVFGISWLLLSSFLFFLTTKKFFLLMYLWFFFGLFDLQSELIQEANLSKFKSEVQSSQVWFCFSLFTHSVWYFKKA